MPGDPCYAAFRGLVADGAVPFCCQGPDNGLTVDEIKEIITHLALYSGWPTAMTAATIFKEVVEKREG